MAPEYWILIIFAAAIAAAVIGFFAGRASAPGERRIREMARERDQARSEAEQVRGEVARHFDESARMFGRLAQDYRAFFEHFADTAQNLGMSEDRARELLHRADPRIVDATGSAAPEDDEAEAQPSPGSLDQGLGGAAEAEGGAPEPAVEPDEDDPEKVRHGEAGRGASRAPGADPSGGDDTRQGADSAETAGTEATGPGEEASDDEPKSEVERQREARGDTA